MSDCPLAQHLWSELDFPPTSSDIVGEGLQILRRVKPCLANSFLGTNFLQGLWNWKKLPEQRRRELIEGKLPSLPLHPTALEALIKADYDDLKRVGNVVETIKDCLLLSSPDRAELLAHSHHVAKLARWAITSEVFMPGHVVKQWKLFAGHLKWRLLESDSPIPELPKDFPGYSAKGDPVALPRFWKETLPWLGRAFRRGIRTKQMAARLQHLISTRGFPAADKREREAAVYDHAQTLFTRPEPDPGRENLLHELSYQIGKFVLARCRENEPQLAHTSLTSSASFSSPVKAGGRAAEIVEKFREWRHAEATEDVDEVSYLGIPYVLRKGMARWRTLGRSADNLYTEPGEPGDSAETLIINPDGTIRFYEDPIHGLDGFTGYQLVMWSIEELINAEILQGKPYVDPSDPLRRGKRLPQIRASAIGEPGWKARIVTVTDGALTVLLQPMSHLMSGYMSRHPNATAGLRRGWQLFEYIKGMSYKPGGVKDPYWLSSDLKTATDFCRHDFSLAMLTGFLKGIGHHTHFSQLCAELLCSPRQYMTEIEPYFGLATERGILMGDPGTKMVLTLHNLCAELEAALRFTVFTVRTAPATIARYVHRHGLACLVNAPWRHFACAGDDHIAYGPKQYLSMITQSHDKNGMCVSWTKNYLSKIGAFYCEEMLLVTDRNRDKLWGVKEPLSKREYETTPHVDALKPRVFSPCAKECDVKDDTNHAIGKARMAFGMLHWLGGGFEKYRPLFSHWWERRMLAYLPDQGYYRYLPTYLGGLGIPGLHLDKEELRQILDGCPLALKQALMVAVKGELPPAGKRLLETFSVSARARGLDTNIVEDQIKEVLSSPDVTQAKELGELKPDDISQLDWENLRYEDKLRLVKSRSGLIPVSEAVKILDRVYTFRDILYPEMSRKHGYDPCRSTKNYENVPWHRRIAHFERVLRELYPQIEDKADSELEWVEIRDQISDLIIKGEQLKTPRKVLMLHRGFLETERLCTLQLPDLHKVKIPPL